MQKKRSYCLSVILGLFFLTVLTISLYAYVSIPVISEYEDSYIFPNDSITPSRDVYIQATCTCDAGVFLASGYPRVVIYKNKDSNPLMINGSTYTVMSPIPDSVNGYKVYMGKFDNGEYTYEIIAQGEDGCTMSTGHSFISSDPSSPTISKYDNSYVLPESNIYSNREIYIQATCIAGTGTSIENEYPRVYVYDKFNKIVDIQGNQYTVLSKIDGSENGYRAKIGQLPIENYTYKIVVKNGFGLESLFYDYFTVESIDTSICYNAPNPFNPNKTTTTIRFNTNQDETVKIKIYSLNSKLVFEDSFDAKVGPNDYVYKGKDGNGNNLYNGVYLCVIEKKGGKVKCKIAIVK